MNKEIISLKEVKTSRPVQKDIFIDWFKEMLNHSPVFYHEVTETWHVFKYEHVKQVLSNYESFQVKVPRPPSLLVQFKRLGTTHPADCR